MHYVYLCVHARVHVYFCVWIVTPSTQILTLILTLDSDCVCVCVHSYPFPPPYNVLAHLFNVLLAEHQHRDHTHCRVLLTVVPRVGELHEIGNDLRLEDLLTLRNKV